MPFEPRLFDNSNEGTRERLEAERLEAERLADVLRQGDPAFSPGARVPPLDRWSADSSDEFLPDEMLLLAEQLAEDSARICAVYPANRRLPIEEVLAAAERESAAEKLRRQRRLRNVAAVAASVAIAAGAWTIRSSLLPADPLLHADATHGSVVPGKPEESAASPGIGMGAAAAALGMKSKSNSETPSLAARPIRSSSSPASVDVKDLSGPELEAVLDLIETEERSEDRLSI